MARFNCFRSKTERPMARHDRLYLRNPGNQRMPPYQGRPGLVAGAAQLSPPVLPTASDSYAPITEPHRHIIAKLSHLKAQQLRHQHVPPERLADSIHRPGSTGTTLPASQTGNCSCQWGIELIEIPPLTPTATAPLIAASRIPGSAGILNPGTKVACPLPPSRVTSAARLRP
jgi:hypothetical protein